MINLNLNQVRSDYMEIMDNDNYDILDNNGINCMNCYECEISNSSACHLIKNFDILYNYNKDYSPLIQQDGLMLNQDDLSVNDVCNLSNSLSMSVHRKESQENIQNININIINIIKQSSIEQYSEEQMFNHDINQKNFEQYIPNQELISQECLVQQYNEPTYTSQSRKNSEKQVKNIKIDVIFEDDNQSQQTNDTSQQDMNENQKRKLLRLKSLAERNVKVNFGTCLIHFIEFLRNVSMFRQKKNLVNEYTIIAQWLRENTQNFTSFQGFRKLFKHHQYGRRFRKLCKLFFQQSFAENYVEFSKIKRQYKAYYYSKIKYFLEGARFPDQFNTFCSVNQKNHKNSQNSFKEE